MNESINSISAERITKKVIALSGVYDSGKTAVLNQLVSRLISLGVAMTPQYGGNLVDNRYRGLFKGKKLVICTSGDTARIIRENFYWARTVPGYDVLVTATRSYAGVQAVDAVIDEAANDGCYPHFVTKMRADGTPHKATSEQQAVEDLLSLIP